jgi:hypothetical protein
VGVGVGTAASSGVVGDGMKKVAKGPVTVIQCLLQEPDVVFVRLRLAAVRGRWKRGWALGKKGARRLHPHLPLLWDWSGGLKDMAELGNLRTYLVVARSHHSCSSLPFSFGPGGS